jgi:gamma-glutamylcysteine synthetase
MAQNETGDGGLDRRATVRTEHEVIGFVTRTCFKTGPPGRVDIESEWFLHPTGPENAADHGEHPDPADHPDLDRLHRVTAHADPLPGGSRLTFEPGGQLELSTACGDHLPHAGPCWDYALDARVMAFRTHDGPWEVDPGMTLREWVSGGTGRARPTYNEVAYHLTTLFPPVRPRGWLELRVIDALPDHLWPVAVAVTAALVEDRTAADQARDAVAGTEHRHRVAARDALRDVVLRRAASRCLAGRPGRAPPAGRRRGLDPPGR